MSTESIRAQLYFWALHTAPRSPRPTRAGGTAVRGVSSGRSKAQPCLASQRPGSRRQCVQPPLQHSAETVASERRNSRPGVRLRAAPRRPILPLSDSSGTSCGSGAAAFVSASAWGKEPRGRGAGSERKRRRRKRSRRKRLLRCGSRRRNAFIREGGRKSRCRSADRRPRYGPARSLQLAAGGTDASEAPRGPTRAGGGSAARGAGRSALLLRVSAAVGLCPSLKSSWDANLGLCWAGGGCEMRGFEPVFNDCLCNSWPCDSLYRYL